MTATAGVVYWPAQKRNVAWRLASCLAREASIAEATGLTVYSIGNESHLKGVGGHTPYRYGEYDGIVKAIDVMLDAKGLEDDFEKWFVRYCQSDIDTSWISFFNVNGKQFGFDGSYRKTSGDHHLHLEIRDGYTNAQTHVFADWRDRNKPIPVLPKEDDLYFLVKTSGSKVVYLSNLVGRRAISDDDELAALKKLTGKNVETVSNLNTYGVDVTDE